MNIRDYQGIVENNLEERLYRHSLGVAKIAESLAQKNGADRCKAYLAGLLHDYGKRYSTNQLMEKAKELSIDLDWFCINEPKLLHAPVGAALLKSELDIYDKELLDAVAYHTTGKAKMTMLGKILYLSDSIEPGREYRGVNEIRSLASFDLDGAILKVVEYTILSVLERKLLLHPLSVELRNDLLLSLRC